MSTLSVLAGGSNCEIISIPKSAGHPPPPGYQNTTWRLPGDYFSSGSFGFKGSALLGYFRRIPGVFRHALQGFFSLYTASMRMDAPLLPCPTYPGKRGASRGLINAIYSRLNRSCVSILAIMAIPAIFQVSPLFALSNPYPDLIGALFWRTPIPLCTPDTP